LLTIKLKAMKIPRLFFLKAFTLFFFAFYCFTTAQAQSTPSKKEKQQAEQARITNMVDSQHYVFNAEIALPLGGRTIQLTGDYYDVEITKTSLVSYLPYFGRAYSASLDPAKAGIQFTSTSFDYKVSPRKKGGWDILIRTKDMQESWQLSLDITESGFASLQVTGGNRQPISFTGTIAEAKKHR
jgi:hypothetical protein